MRIEPHPAHPPTPVPRSTVVALVALLSALLLLASCSGPATPAVISVNGRVITLGDPVANASILVGGKVTATAADGTFTVNDVTTPYDVTVSFQSSTDVWIFQGLTRPDPTLQLLSFTPGFQATVSGTIGTAPYQTNEVGAVVPAGTTVAFGGAVVKSGTTSFGPGTIRWGPDDPLQTTLYALRVVLDSNNQPASYTGFGSLAVTLHNGDALTGLAVPTQPVATAALSGSISAPPGFSFNGAGVVLRIGPASGGTVMGLPVNLVPPGTFSNAMVPVASGIGYGLIASAGDGSAGDSTAAWDTVTAPNASATLALPTPSQPIAPAPNAVGVGPGTTLSATALAGSIYLFRLAPSGTTGPTVTIVTTDASTTLPDLSAINRALPSGASYTLQVSTVGSFTSMNAAAAAPGAFAKELELEGLLGGGSGPTGVSGPDQPAWFTSSKATAFTTAP